MMKRACLGLTATTILLGSGCASGPEASKVNDDYFFPSPPDPPRIQYLRSYNGSPDFKKKKVILEYLAGAEAPQEYEITKAFSVATSKGKIYVTDSFGAKGLNVFDLQAGRFYILGKEPGVAEIRKPIHVFVDGEGLKYVSDLLRRQVLVYGVDDSYLRYYGDGTSFLPLACAVFGKEVYILDGDKDKVKDEDTDEEVEERRDQILVLEKETGKPLRRIGKHGSGEEGFAFASHMCLDRLGNIYISDFLNHRVVKMDSRGNVLLAFGRQGDRAGDFSQMKGVAVDPNGFIYVVDAGLQIAQVFDNGGTPLFPLGGIRAPKGPMNLPAGIWIDDQNLEYFREYLSPDFEPEYLVLVANQLSQSDRICVYAFGKKKGVDYATKEKVVTLEGKKEKPLWQMPVVSVGEDGAKAPPKAGGSEKAGSKASKAAPPAPKKKPAAAPDPASATSKKKKPTPEGRGTDEGEEEPTDSAR